MWLLTLFFLAFSESSEMLLYTTHHLALPLLRRMGVHAERHRCRGVTQHVLQRFYVRADGDRNGGQGVPLRYNYDKPEEPRRIKGFEVFSLVFSSFSKPKNHTEISRIIGGVSLTTNE